MTSEIGSIRGVKANAGRAVLVAWQPYGKARERTW